MDLSTRGSRFYTVLLPLLLLTASLQLEMLQAIETQADDDFQLTIITDPQGPSYLAGSWLRLACRALNLSEDFTYQWVGKCNETGDIELTVDEPLLDDEYYAEFWLFTTPRECLDLAECNIIDLETFEVVATASVFIGMVTGIGISIENQFNPGVVFDNTSLILTPSDCLSVDTPTILCHSSSKSTADTSYWMDPNGDILSSNTSDSRVAYTAVNLTLCEESPDDSVSEGVYTCVAIDENGQTVSTYLGVYFDKTQVNEILTNMDFHIDGDSLHLEFTSEGLPATSAQWNKDSTPLQIDNNNFTSNQVIVNTTKASYVSELVIKDFTQHATGSGSSFKCDVYMDWSEVDSYGLVEENEQHVSGTFLLTTLGQQATIECAFSKVVSNVEWLGPPLEGSQIIRSSARNRISMTIHVRVEHHSQSLMCRGVDHNGEFVYIPYLIIVHIPLAIEVTPLVDSEPVLGFSHTLRCCALIGNTSEDLFDGLLLEWLHHVDNGPVVTIATRDVANMRRDRRPCIRLTFDPLTESDTGTYECRSTLMASQQQVVRTVQYELQVLPRIAIETSSTTTPPTKDTSTTLTFPSGPAGTAADESSDQDVLMLSITIAASFAFVVVVVIVVLMLALAVNLWLLKRRRNKMVEMSSSRKEREGHSSEEKPPVMSTTTMSNGTIKSV